MIYTIEEIKQKAIPIAQEYGVDSMSLFGSYARGEASEDSDLDFFIDRGDIKGLLDLFKTWKIFFTAMLMLYQQELKINPF